MEGQVHFIIGAGLGGIALASSSDPNYTAAAIMGAMTHPVLDDANVGKYGVYHGLGEGASKVWLFIFYSLAIFAGAWLTWHHPGVGMCGLIAWLSYDHAWGVRWAQKRLGKRATYPSLHGKFMFPDWMQTRWGLIPRCVFLGLFVWMVML